MSVSVGCYCACFFVSQLLTNNAFSLVGNKGWANPPESCDVYEGQKAGPFDQSSSYASTGEWLKLISTGILAALSFFIHIRTQYSRRGQD